MGVLAQGKASNMININSSQTQKDDHVGTEAEGKAIQVEAATSVK